MLQPDPSGLRRLLIIRALLLAGAMVILVRLVMLQIWMAPELSRTADLQHRTEVITPARRGDILDRYGVPLSDQAGNYVSLGVNPKRVTDPRGLAADLARLTGRSTEYYLKRLNRAADFVHLARKLPPTLADRIDRRNWNLIRQTETHRVYPHGALAGQVVGFTDIDGVGIAGLEKSCDELLRGTSGRRIYQLDVQGRPHIDPAAPLTPPIDGLDVVLTLDLRIQSLVEEELAPAVIVEKALSAVAIVLDPKTGEVLALASLPAFDPGQPDTQPQEYQKNRAVVDIFEPGSTFKIVAAAALLESGRATLRSTIDCSAGSVTIHGKTIRDAKRHGVLTLQEVLAYSSNVGTILLSRALEKRELYDMVRRFGFLAKSGIEVEGEASGMLPAPSDWSGLTQPTLVIGQGVAATALQMAMAYGAIANRGTLLRPTLIRGHFNRDGEFVSREPVRIRQVVSPSTAKAITLALVQVVEKGTGRKAKVEGVTIAAKTGTAQISSPEGGYHDDRYYASMCGFLPAEDPQYLIFIGMDSPRGASGLHQGGDVAAPIFKRIATRIAGLDPAMLASSPAKERGSGRKVPTTGKALASPSKRGRSLPQLVKMPDLRMKPAGEAEASLKSIGLNVTLRGEGTVVVDQVPEVGEEIPAGTRVNLTIGPPKRSARGAVVVPHLVGLSIRDAIRKASESGLTVQVNGRGKVVEQHPSSGSRVNWGDVCRLEARS